MTLRERARELVAKWSDKEANVWDTITVKECIDELAAALVAEGPSDAPDLREKMIAILLEHETSYIKSSYDKVALYLWKCSCGDEEGRELTWDDCHKKTREHWADKYFAAAAPSLHKESETVTDELVFCIRSLLPIAHLSCQDDNLKPSLEECTDGACAHAKDLLRRTALHKEGAGGDAAIRNATIEEIASFAETHYCIMDANSLGGYKTCERPKHPNEPFARAIRALMDCSGGRAASPAGRAEQEPK